MVEHDYAGIKSAVRGLISRVTDPQRYVLLSILSVAEKLNVPEVLIEVA
jgi:hypothetical protein